ncbi:hypothetical protein [Pseudarthrobacter chlorophenolicus]|uniref:hypothetical protein n=1 Tax=Pseudarthrobacter chlorophenolicus TaxID=85085 RepID=UPI0014962149|nr:hypothetical protein [Pseudarthrobacter chlorophenolicus]
MPLPLPLPLPPAQSTSDAIGTQHLNSCDRIQREHRDSPASRSFCFHCRGSRRSLSAGGSGGSSLPAYRFRRSSLPAYRFRRSSLPAYRFRRSSLPAYRFRRSSLPAYRFRRSSLPAYRFRRSSLPAYRFRGGLFLGSFRFRFFPPVFTE